MSATQRNAGCGETSTNGRGVIYYKLSPGYSGDTTKNCGLVGNEIDNNFYFLRGYDIETAVYSEETGKLTFKRVNGETFSVDVDMLSGSTFDNVEFEFDSVNGVLKIIYPDGRIKTVSGFTVNGINEIATDSTLLGNGFQNNPLRLNPIEGTGTYSPANIYIDLTDSGATFPASSSSRGFRIVTKEYSNAFGRLYNFESVEKISRHLQEEGNGWRVPTKQDLDELLNALECDEYKSHSALTLGYLGKVAGQALKSQYFWDEYNAGQSRDDTNGLDTIGMTIYPTGNDDDDEVAEEFGTTSVLWTSTDYGNELVYAKVFSYNRNDVRQEAHEKIHTFNSIRLVKDYNINNHSEIETILGLTYPTVLIRIPESNYIKIWTKINFYDEDEELTWIPINSSGADIESIGTVYYANEWDGTKWVKKQLREGDSIVILNKEGIEYREWRLKHGELYDIFGEDFNDDLANIWESIYNLSSSTVSFSASVVNNFSAINQTIIENYDELSERIDELSANTKTFGDGLQVNNNVVSIKIDENDEGYLQVDENGLRTEGINDAIGDAKTEVYEYITSAMSYNMSGMSADASKYEVYSDDIVIRRSPTGRTLGINIDTTLRKIPGASANTLGSAIRIGTNGEGFFLIDNNGNPLPNSEIIAFNDKCTIKNVELGRDRWTVNENGIVDRIYDQGVPAWTILYKDAEGNYQLKNITLDDLLDLVYIGNGLTMTDRSFNSYKKLSVQIHPRQEYLYLDEHGLYVSGITEGFEDITQYIDNSIQSAMTTIRQEISAYTENVINNFYQSLSGNVQDIVKSYISGTPYEIEVKEINPQSPLRKLLIGFTEDALFGTNRDQ
jgi:uncharacterized protein (TIGR02145 family)